MRDGKKVVYDAVDNCGNNNCIISANINKNLTIPEASRNKNPQKFKLEKNIRILQKDGNLILEKV